MHVLVTGATGFMGPRVVERLVAHGHSVRCLVRRTSDLSPLQAAPIEVWAGDVTDPATLPGALEGVQAVVHLVGILKERPPDVTFERIHVGGTRRVVEAAKAAGLARIFYMSAIGAKPDPAYPYHNTKWQAEELVKGSGIPYTILRSSIVFGPRDEFMNRFAAMVRRPPTGDRTLAPFVPVIGSGKTRFQPIFVEDLAECAARVMGDEAMAGRLIEVGGPELFTYEQLIDIVMDTIGIHRPKVHVPVLLMRPAVALMPLVYKDPPLTREQLSMINLDNVAETTDVVLRVFGFQPVHLRDKISYIIEESK